MLKKILHLIQQSGALMMAPRSHGMYLGNTFDTVASHSHHASVIAYCLARMESLTHEQSMKAVTMAVFHDITNARTGDFDFVERHYVKVDAQKAAEDQFKDISFGDDLKNLIQEFEDTQSLEAKCAQDATSLEQLYQEWVLMWQGNLMAETWFTTDFNDRVPAFYTQSAEKLAHAMKDSTPQDWWWSQFIGDDETAEDLEKLIGKK